MTYSEQHPEYAPPKITVGILQLRRVICDVSGLGDQPEPEEEEVV